LQARYFFQQLICGVSYCHFMVRTKKKRSILFSLSQQEELVHHFVLTKQVSNTKSVVHLQQICHRDLKLENTLLDGSPAPRLKICDFGYSKVPCFPS